MAFEKKYDKVNKKYPSASPLFHEFNMLNLDGHCKLTTGKGPIKLIKRVKTANSFLQFVSDQFHVIILSLPM